ADQPGTVLALPRIAHTVRAALQVHRSRFRWTPDYGEVDVNEGAGHGFCDLISFVVGPVGGGGSPQGFPSRGGRPDACPHGGAVHRPSGATARIEASG